MEILRPGNHVRINVVTSSSRYQVMKPNQVVNCKIQLDLTMRSCRSYLNFSVCRDIPMLTTPNLLTYCNPDKSRVILFTDAWASDM